MIGKFLNTDIGKRLAGPGLAALIIKVGGAGLSYVMLVAFARMLDAESYGQFGLMLNLSIVLAAAIGFGLPTMILRLWPEHMVKGQPQIARGAMLQGLVIILAGSGVLLLISAVLSAFGIGEQYFGYRAGALLVALLAVASVFADYLSSALRVLGHTIASMAPRDIFWRIGSPALAFFVLHNTGELSAFTAIVSAIVVLAVVVIAQAWQTLRETNRETKGLKAAGRWRDWRSFLFPVWASSLLYTMIQQLDVVVVGAMIGPAEAGSYFAAQKTASLLGLTMLAGGLVAAPLMAAAFHAGKRDDLQKLCRYLSTAIALTTLAGLLVLALFGRQLLSIFDPAYANSYAVLMVLCVGYAVDSLSGPNSYMMQMTGLEGKYLTVMTVVYAAVLSLQIIFIPIYGVLAAAGANALGSVMWNVAAVWLLRQKTGVDPSVLSLLRRD